MVNQAILKRHFSDHSSFLVMVVGAVMLFAASLLLKPILSAENYGIYGLLVTYISLVFSFGLLGLEQVLLRLAWLDKNGSVFITKRLMYGLSFCIFVIPVCLTFFAHVFYLKEIGFWPVYLISVCSVLSLLSYNLARIKSRFFVSQIQTNLWKILLGIFSLWFFLEPTNISVDLVVWVLVLSLFVSFIVSAYVVSSSSVCIQSNHEKNEVTYFFGFFFNMGILAVFNFSDRIIIEHIGGVAAVGEYFYFLVLCVSPFSLVGNYIGFKKLVEYKTGFNKKKFNNELFKVGLTSLLLIIMYGFLIRQGLYSGLIKGGAEYHFLLLPMLGLSWVKMVYSILSSAIGAVGKIRMVFLINIWSVLVAIIVFFLLFSFQASLSYVVWGIVFVWFVRSVFFYWGVVRSTIILKYT